MAKKHRKKQPKKPFLQEILQEEIVFPGQTRTEVRAISAAVKRGELRRLAPKIFSANLHEDPALLIRRNWLRILGHLYPGAVISFRSAFLAQPEKGHIQLSYSYTDKRRLPGIEVHLWKAPGPLAGDAELPGGLRLASDARRFLENNTRAHGKEKKTISATELEERLEKILVAYGETKLNKIRDEARKLKHWKIEFSYLDKQIGALLSTRPAKYFRSPLAKARHAGEPYDSVRMKLFEKLFSRLQEGPWMQRKAAQSSAAAWKAISFFDAYFSNYIEGTRFAVEEAIEIIYEGHIGSRPKDAHDIAGVFDVLVDHKKILKTPDTAEQFLSTLLQRHGQIFKQRPESRPGLWKERSNQAGNTIFVSPPLVVGTLKQGFAFYRALPEGFARAAYMMFLISEVHPFDDGNGRMARIQMNAELCASNVERILIVNSYREDYLTVLKKFSRTGDPEPYLRMLEKAQEYSAALPKQNFDELFAALGRTNAFLEPREGKLLMP